MLAYYVVLNDFGFMPSQVQFVNSYNAIIHNSNDVYNPTAWNFGNSALSSTSCNNGNTQQIDWIYQQTSFIDLRMSAINCNTGPTGLPIYSQIFVWGKCNVQQISPYTNLPVCYTT
jgi:hypothetical protein